MLLVIPSTPQHHTAPICFVSLRIVYITYLPGVLNRHCTQAWRLWEDARREAAECQEQARRAAELEAYDFYDALADELDAAADAAQAATIAASCQPAALFATGLTGKS